MSFLPVNWRPVSRTLRGCAVLMMLTVPAGLAGCGTMSTLVMRPDFVPPERELQLGRQAYHQHLAVHPPIEDPEPTEIVEVVGDRLAEASGRTDFQWEFVLTLDPSSRVVAFPGGKVVVSDGMLATCENEAELAAVMAHEIGHMLAGHGARRLLDANPTYAADAPPAKFRNARMTESSRGGAAGSLKPFNPQQEEEADSIALSLLVRAGYDPDVMRTIWAGHTRHGNENRFGEFARRHPTNHDRHAEFLETLAQAKVVYRSHKQQLGQGTAIAYTAHYPQESSPQIAGVRIDAWTAAEDRGGAKPQGWNADLVETQWLPPTQGEREPVGEVLHVEHEWTAPSKGRTADHEEPAKRSWEDSSPGPMLRPIEQDDPWERALRPIE